MRSASARGVPGLQHRVQLLVDALAHAVKEDGHIAPPQLAVGGSGELADPAR